VIFRRVWFSVGWAIGLAHVAANAAESGDAAQPDRDIAKLAKWFESGAAEVDFPLAADELDDWRKALFTAYSAADKKTGKGRFNAPQPLEPGKKTRLSAGFHHIAEGLDMPYVVFSRGGKPEGGWPLVIAMHGGGGTSEKLPTPHAWPVNTAEWRAQISLATSVYPDGAIYFVPRMVDDNQGRWWRDFNPIAFDAVIRHGIVHWELNPDRIYMLGISEGGYGTEVLATRMTDRLAAVSAMSCGYGSSIHVENLRNLAYRTDVGEKDTMFGRLDNVRENFKRLGEFHKKDPDGYLFSLNEQKGKGHGVDYRPGPAWMIAHRRKTHPDRVVLTTYRADKARNDRAYWLQITKDLGGRDLYFDARIDRAANAIDIKAEATAGDAVYQSPDWAKALADPGPLVPADGAGLRLWLHESLIDFSKPVIVRINGKTVRNQRITPSLRAMVESIRRNGDPQRIYPAYLDLEAGGSTP
jgi:hypothetical protein